MQLGKFLKRWILHPIKRRVAKYYLVLLRRFFGLKVIGITGSAGKTTTKEMLASILSLEGETIASIANIDPVYNIPTTILRCKPTTQFLVLEMGVEYPGEMDFYLWLAKPDIGIITNIYPTHTEFFGDSSGVFREKSKLVKSLSREAFAILNRKDKFLRKLDSELKSKIVWFGDGTAVMSSLEKYTSDFKTEFLLIFNQNPKEKIKIKLPVFGSQFVANAQAASATAYSLRVPLKKIKKGLETFPPQEHRMKIIKHFSGAIILDDSYNSNPEAAKETLREFLWLSGDRNKIVVFGDMLELGFWENKYHMNLGEFMGRLRLTKLVCVGKASRITADYAKKSLGAASVTSVASWKEAASEVKPLLKRNTSVLVKGSRSIGLDKVVSKLS